MGCIGWLCMPSRLLDGRASDPHAKGSHASWGFSFVETRLRHV